MIIKVSKYRRKPQRRTQAPARQVKVLKPRISHEENPAETKSQPSRIVRQIRNVRPLTPATALFAWNSMFQIGVA